MLSTALRVSQDFPYIGMWVGCQGALVQNENSSLGDKHNLWGAQSCAPLLY